MAKTIPFEEFIKIVPEETKEFVTGYLSRIKIDAIKEIDVPNKVFLLIDRCKKVIKPMSIFSYVYNEENDYIGESKAVLNICDYNDSYMCKIWNDTGIKNDESQFSYLFGYFSDLFCICEKMHEYYSLIPEKIIYESIGKFKFKPDDSYLDYKCFPNGINTLKSKFEELKAQKEQEKIKELKTSFIKDIPIEISSYLETSAIIYNYFSNSELPFYEPLDNIDEADLIDLSLIIGLYYDNNTKNIVNFLSSVGLEKKDIFKFNGYKIDDIKSSIFNYFRHNYLDYLILIKNYTKFVNKENEDLSVIDVFSNLLDRKISDSLLLERFLNKKNVKIKTKEELVISINNYIKNEKTDEIQSIYNGLPLKTITYLEYLSKVYDIISENKDNSRIEYKNESITRISVLMTIFLKNYDFAAYFLEYNINLEKCLNYFGITTIDVDSRNLNMDSLRYVYKEIVLNTGLNNDNNLSIRTIINTTLHGNNKGMLKLLSDLNDYFVNKSYLGVEIELYLDKKEKKRRLKQKQEFYDSLNIDVIRYIESSYIFYTKLKESVSDYSNDDLVELALLMTISKSENQMANFICEKLFENRLSSELNLKDYKIIITATAYEDSADILFISKYYGKYIFGGKNKDKKKEDITLNDIICNLFNSGLNDSIMLKKMLSKYNLTYNDFLDIHKTSFEYNKNEILTSKEITNFELIDSIDKIYRTIQDSRMFSKKHEVCSIASHIYLFYSDNNMVKYLINRGITLEKIAEFINMEKSDIDNFRSLETDFDHIKKLSNFVFHDAINDIIIEIKEKAHKYSFNHVITRLCKFVGTDFQELRYELLNNESYDVKIKRDCIEKIKEEKCDFLLVDSIDKISRVIYPNIKNNIKSIYLASYIYLFYCKNNKVQYLIDRGITLEKITKFIDIPKQKIDDYVNLDTDYRHIMESECKFIFAPSIEKIIERTLYLDEDLKCNNILELLMKYVDSSANVNDLIFELKNDKKTPPTKIERLESYRTMKIPAIDIEKIESMTNVSDLLIEQSDAIFKEFSLFIEDKYSNDDSSIEIQNSIESMCKKRVQEKKINLFSFIKSNKKEDENQFNKKEIIEQLSGYLEQKEKRLNEGIKELIFIRQSIAVYLTKANECLDVLNNAKDELNEEIQNKEYLENDFRIFDDNLRKQLLDEKISGITTSIIGMIQQYQKVTMQLTTHASLSNKVSIARNTTIQNLYIELALNEGVSREKESIDTLNYLVGLLKDVDSVNQVGMIDNIKKINDISKEEQVVLSDNDKMLISQILIEQNMNITSFNDNKKSQMVKKKD